MPVAQLVNLIWRYKSGLVYRGAALMFTGLPIVFADRATGVVTAPADDPELGWLALTVMGLALILPYMATGLVKLNHRGSAWSACKFPMRPRG